MLISTPPPSPTTPPQMSLPVPDILVMDDSEAIPARIIEGLKDKTFAEGEDIVLRCRVEGKPSPTVKVQDIVYTLHSLTYIRTGNML